MTTHSPAPWSVSTDPYPHIRDGDDNCILARDCFPKDADKRILENGPDLLAALEKVQDWLEGCSDIHTVQRYVSNALNKVKGAQGHDQT